MLLNLMLKTHTICFEINYKTQVDQEEGDSEGSGRYGTIPPFPPPPPGLDGNLLSLILFILSLFPVK